VSIIGLNFPFSFLLKKKAVKQTNQIDGRSQFGTNKHYRPIDGSQANHCSKALLLTMFLQCCWMSTGRGSTSVDLRDRQTDWQVNMMLSCRWGPRISGTL